MALQKISWVLPIFNEAGNIPKLYDSLKSLEQKISNKYTAEFIFVDDGSKDNSMELLTGLYEKDKSVKIITFARNFGHQFAITAGLDAANGDAIIFMDADLQDPPEVCFDLIAAWENGSDVAYAKRRTRKDSFMKKLTAYWFYRLLRRTADIEIPADTGDFRLISKQVGDVLRGFPEKHRFIRGLISYIGFTQTPVLFDREDRKVGKSGYSLKKMFRLAEDAFTGFSLAPIMMVGLSGMLLAAAGFTGTIIGLIADKSIVVLLGFITILTGIILLALATIGQYIGRTYQQVQGRPLYIVKKKLEHKA